MEEDSETCIRRNVHQDEKPKNELESPSDAGHVALRNTDEKDDVEFPLTCQSDSLALLSVYRYARQIKSFLGWENFLEECEIEENDQNSLSKETGSHSSDGEASNGEHSDERLNESEIRDEIFSDDSRQNGRNSCEISGYSEERISKYLKDLNENSDHYGSDSSICDAKKQTGLHGKIFRSEVQFTVEDWRNQTVLPLLSARSTSITSNNSTSNEIIVMDKSLVEEDASIDAGLNLNDAANILKDEYHLHKLSTNGINIVDDCAKFEEGIANGVDDCDTPGEKSTEENAKDLCEIFESDNILNNENEEEKSMLHKDRLNKHLTKVALNKNVENKGEEADEKITGKEDNCLKENIMDNAKELEKSLKNNVDKLVSPINEKHVNNVTTSKAEKTLKVHIQYENEITKQPVSKVAIYGENQNVNSRDNTYSEDTECGFSIFRPRWLQPFATVKCYVILYSIIGVLHGSYYSYLIGALSTLEKRYAFKSKISGAIMVADEVTPLLLGVIIGYYAGKANRPRMIAFGMLLSAGCCFCSSLPYFIYGPVKSTTFHNVLAHISPKFCDSNSGKDSCELEGRPPTLPAVLFLVFGSFLKGFGNLAYYAIGLAYLDDNSSKKNTPIYLAITLALRLLGPLVGFLMSSVFLKFYEKPTDDPGYGPDDPRWVGAWWIGFFLQGVLLLICTMPIALFPRRLPGQKRMEHNTAPGNEDGWKQIFLGLFSALKRLGTNPVFVLIIVNTNMKIFGHFGHSIMLPKYMENQFRLSASQASLYSGATSIAFVMFSTILGGYLIWKFRPSIKVLLGGMIVSEAMLCIGFLILLIPRCQPVDMVNFGMNDEGIILNSACNQQCDCSTTSYTPFCGPEGTTYFSPCYAGCTQEILSSTSSKLHKEFRNCTCLAASGDLNVAPTISEGVCPDENCWSQALAYLITYFFLLTISNAFTVAASMILLRSVHPNDKSIALGTFETFICLFGFIPFPVTFGALVDSACLVWEKSCGETGNCWYYDMEKYSYLLHGVASVFCSFSVMCLIGLYCLSSRVRDLYVDDDEEKEYADIKLDTVSGSVTKL